MDPPSRMRRYARQRAATSPAVDVTSSEKERQSNVACKKRLKPKQRLSAAWPSVSLR